MEKLKYMPLSVRASSPSSQDSLSGDRSSSLGALGRLGKFSSRDREESGSNSFSAASRSLSFTDVPGLRLSGGSLLFAAEASALKHVWQCWDEKRTIHTNIRTKLSATNAFVMVVKEIPDGETYGVTSCHKVRIRKDFLIWFKFSAVSELSIVTLKYFH